MVLLCEYVTGGLSATLRVRYGWASGALGIGHGGVVCSVNASGGLVPLCVYVTGGLVVL